MLILKIIAFL